MCLCMIFDCVRGANIMHKKFIEFELPIDMPKGSVVFIDSDTGKPYAELSKRVREGVFPGPVPGPGRPKRGGLTLHQEALMRALLGNRQSCRELREYSEQNGGHFYNPRSQAMSLVKRDYVGRKRGVDSHGHRAYLYYVTKQGRDVLAGVALPDKETA